MLKSRTILLTALGVCVVGFVFGIVALFQLRFDSGDIYPPYSSLRADPLGTKALYESLQSLPGLEVRRFFEDNSKLEGSPKRVLFVAGTDVENLQFMSEDDFKTLQSFMVRGGRLLVSLAPVPKQDPHSAPTSPAFSPRGKKSLREKKTGQTNTVEVFPDEISFLEKIGAHVRYDDLTINDTGESRPENAYATEVARNLPDTVSWHTAIYFDQLETNWQVLYRRKKHPVVIERAMGSGTLVLSSDSYFLSNEALRSERHADLLAWLVGSHREIIFDETHLGVEDHPGIANLMRRYRLAGVVVGLLALAGLYIWRNSIPLIPPLADNLADSSIPSVRGKESSAGFASLLRRSIPPSEILLTCFTEWKIACGRQPRAAARLAEIERVMEEEKARSAGSRRPLETYQTIHRILTERK